MAEAKRQEPEMETTESYRGPVREVSNVERIYRPANDNKLKTRRRRTPAPGTGNRVPNVRFRRSALNRTPGVSPAIEKGMAVANATAATWTIIGGTSFMYPIQLAFALLQVLGFFGLVALEESFLDYIDFFDFGTEAAERMFYISVAVLFVLGLVTLFTAIAVYTIRGVKMMGDGVGLIITAVCLALYVIPVFSLVPWMWLWCLYVVKSQVDKK